MTGQQDTKVVTGKLRLSYVSLLDPREPDEPGGKAKYSALLLIPKSDKDTVKALRRAAIEATRQGVASGKLRTGTEASTAWQTLKDGDQRDDLDDRPEYVGHWYMNVASLTRPGIIDAHKQKVDSSDVVYSGCYARVSVSAYPYNVGPNRGVTFGLDNVQILGHGDMLGGRSRAEDDFDEYDDGDDWDDGEPPF